MTVTNVTTNVVSQVIRLREGEVADIYAEIQMDKGGTDGRNLIQIVEQSNGCSFPLGNGASVVRPAFPSGSSCREVLVTTVTALSTDNFNFLLQAISEGSNSDVDADKAYLRVVRR